MIRPWKLYKSRPLAVLQALRIFPKSQLLQVPDIHNKMSVDQFDYITAPKADEIVASLIRNGGCILRNFITDAAILDTIERDVRPHIQADKPWEGVEFFPPETRRVMGLAGKSRTFTNAIPANPLYRDVCSRLLSSTYRSWYGYQLNTTISEPQLSNTIVFSIGPGARRQELHRDDSIHHNHLCELRSHHDYRIGRDTSAGLFVAGKKTTRANGATRFIPGPISGAKRDALMRNWLTMRSCSLEMRLLCLLPAIMAEVQTPLQMKRGLFTAVS